MMTPAELGWCVTCFAAGVGLILVLCVGLVTRARMQRDEAIARLEARVERGGD